MSKIDLQYDLANLTPANAAPPQANFSRIEQHINQELIERGGTVAMTAQLKLVGDPVAPLDAAPKQYVDAVLPIGLITMYSGAAAPPGGSWAVCNGAELQTTEYPELFAVCAYDYGGTGGRFNLPNLVDRFPRGSAPGTSGGNADAALVTHEHSMTHDHPGWTTTVQDADHYHVQQGNTGQQAAGHYHYLDQLGTILRYNPNNPALWLKANPAGADYPVDVLNAGAVTTAYDAVNHVHPLGGPTTGMSASHTHVTATPQRVANTSTVGVAATNANLPPYQGVTFVIRVR